MSSNASSSGFNPQNPYLTGVFAKMHRAWHHIQDLDLIFERWIKTQPWSVETECNAEGRPKRLVFRIHSPIPAEAGLVVGDALHNLRSALDHLAGVAATRNGRSTKGVYFPVAPNEASFPSASADKLRKCPDVFRSFVAGLHPYGGGNEAIHTLHHLDILDKHQVLAPICVSTNLTIDADQGFYGAVDLSRTTEPVRVSLDSIGDGDTILDYTASFRAPSPTEVHTKCSLSVVFSNESPAAGKNIGKTVHWLFKEVERIVMLAEINHFR